LQCSRSNRWWLSNQLLNQKNERCWIKRAS
jgi:hypothetical protein